MSSLSNNPQVDSSKCVRHCKSTGATIEASSAPPVPCLVVYTDSFVICTCLNSPCASACAVAGRQLASVVVIENASHRTPMVKAALAVAGPITRICTSVMWITRLLTNPVARRAAIDDCTPPSSCLGVDRSTCRR